MEEDELYKLLDVVCEHCGKDIRLPYSEGIWVADDRSPTLERRAYFCDEFCLFDWWNSPPTTPPSNGGSNID
jgi:hypothetical protein